MRKSVEDSNNKILELAKAGMTMKNIAAEVHCSVGTVSGALKSEGYLEIYKENNRVKKIVTKEKGKALVALAKKGLTHKEIANAVGVSESTASRYLRDVGCKAVEYKAKLKFTDEFVKAVAKDREEGMSWSKLTRKYHSSQETLTKYMQRAGYTLSVLERSSSRLELLLSKDQQKSLILDFLQDVSLVDLLEKYDIKNIKVLLRYIEMLGLERSCSDDEFQIDSIDVRNSEEQGLSIIEKKQKKKDYKHKYTAEEMDAKYGRGMWHIMTRDEIKHALYTDQFARRIANVEVGNKVEYKKITSEYIAYLEEGTEEWVIKQEDF